MNIRGRNVRVNEVLSGEIGKDLREIFFRALEHDIKKIHPRETAAAGMKNAQQVGMREMRSACPGGELAIGRGGIRGDEFDGGFLRLRRGALREEDDAVFGAR